MAVVKRGNLDPPTHTYQVTHSVINIVEMGEGDTLFIIFVIKLTTIYCCHGNHINQILSKMALLKREFVYLHIHTKFVYL